MYYSDTDPAMEMEALEVERFEADREYAQMRTAGRVALRAHDRMLALYRAGRTAEAAKVCRHGAMTTPLSHREAVRNDPQSEHRNPVCPARGSCSWVAAGLSVS